MKLLPMTQRDIRSEANGLTRASRLLALVAGVGLGAVCAAPRVPPQSACADLAGKTFGNGLVLEAEEIPGSTRVETAYGGGAVLDRPTCRVRGQIKPSSDSDIRFEVWLPEPAAWNGRYQGTGGGGNAGNMSLSSMRNALDGGYAVSGQDNGHVGSSDDSSFAVGHPEKVIDSKAIIAASYGRAPDLSLFNGCSTGGRQGLALAQRFPEDYDGISAGAPANYWPELNALHAEFGRFLVENPDSWVSPEKMKMVQDAVHEACGAIDGIIEDPGACTFDVSTLACAGEPGDDCLTEGEMAGIEKRFADLVDDDGTLIYPSFTHGLESMIGPNWMGSDPENPFYSSRTWRYPDRFFADYVHGRADWSIREFDWKKDLKAAREGVIGISVAAEDPDLSAFARSGGKLLQWHGWQDTGIPARNSIRYYEEVVAEMGADAVEPFYRLFMGTGVDHCGGGLGPNSIGSTFGVPAPQRDADHDVMEALARWVEEGEAPEQIIATRYGDDGSVVAQRPWCAFPKVARWDGQGDRTKVESYSCVIAGRRPEPRSWP
jgi:hypothetical protein